jgi:hypothetical protein
VDPTTDAIMGLLAKNAPAVAAILGGSYVLKPYIAPLALWVKERIEARAAREAQRDKWIEGLVEKFKSDSDIARQEFLAALRTEQKVISDLAAAIRAGGPSNA